MSSNKYSIYKPVGPYFDLVDRVASYGLGHARVLSIGDTNTK
jgi:hypothetical protein